MMRKEKLIAVLIVFLLIITGCSKEDVADSSSGLVNDESETIVKIEAREFVAEDMEFYTFMQKVKNEINRIADAEGLEGQALEETNKFWAKENERYDHVNTQLQNMIEMYAMSLLAKEKNYFIPMEKLDKELADFNAIVARHTSIQEMIEAYGEKEYKLNSRSYTEESMLRKRIVKDLDEEIREANPNASEQEIKYLISNAYDDLYEDHVSQLNVEINLQ